MFFQIQKLSKKNNNYEYATNTITDTQLTAINNQISSIYNMDVEAIRNLGAISKSLLTGTNYHSTTVGIPGTLTIPADTTQFIGGVNVDNNLTVSGKDTTLKGLTFNNIILDQTKTDASIGHIVSDNGPEYKALMILGNNSAGGQREVKVLDNMEVMNKLKVGGAITNTQLQTNGNGTITGNLTAGSVNTNEIKYTKLTSKNTVLVNTRYGGGGGGYFDSRCPPGQVMIGIHGSAGGYVDSIGIICA